MALQPPKELRAPIRFAPAWIAAGVAAGVVGDLALRRPPWNNAAGTLLVIVLAGGLLFSGKIRTTSSRVALVVAAGFGLMLSVRTDPQLVAFNILAVVTLVFVATMRQERLFDYRPLQGIRDSLESINQGALLLNEIPTEIQARKVAARRQGIGPSRSAAVLRGLLLATPMVLVLGLLLGSADVVFASFFSSPVSFGSLIGHLTLMGIGFGTMALLIRLAHTGSAGEVEMQGPTLGKIETFVVLSCLNALFGAFVIAQLLARTGAAEEALAAAGLTYKEYARQGFFQLLWVAGLMLVILLSLRALTISWARSNRLFQGLSLVAVALTLVVVGVAFTRLQLYIADDGLTPLRFYSSAFSLWVGVAFVIVAVRLANVRPDQAWTMPTLFASGLVALFALNLMNPEAIMANNNLDRDERSMLFHMEKFTADGQITLINGLDRLTPELRTEVTEKLCRIGTAPGGRTQATLRDDQARLAAGDDRVVISDGGWLSWNLGQRNAESGLRELCAPS